MQSVGTYLGEILRHLVFLVTSSAIAAGLAIWGLFGGPPIAWYLSASILLVFVVVAGYLAWKEKHDALKVLLDRKAIADFLGQILEETNHWWDDGFRVTPDEAVAAKWCEDYDSWIVGLKERVAGKLGTAEVISIFQIGPGLLDAKLIRVGPTIAVQHRMTCLKLHMEGLQTALTRYLPSN